MLSAIRKARREQMIDERESDQIKVNGHVDLQPIVPSSVTAGRCNVEDRPLFRNSKFANYHEGILQLRRALKSENSVKTPAFAEAEKCLDEAFVQYNNNSTCGEILSGNWYDYYAPHIA